MAYRMEAGPVTKIRYRRVCEKPVDVLLNLGTRSGVTIYTCILGRAYCYDL
jgi:hypothetical protein